MLGNGLASVAFAAGRLTGFLLVGGLVVVLIRNVVGGTQTSKGKGVDYRAHAAQWAADPTGRHEPRYWNGVSWTAYVSDGGIASEAPLQ